MYSFIIDNKIVIFCYCCRGVRSASRDEKDQTERDGRPSWMRALLDSARTWMGMLPDSLVTLRRTVENIKDPLYRFFEREVNSGARLLQVVRQDLNDVVLICQVT